MKSLILKLFVVLTLACAPLSGYCAGDGQPQVSNNDENAAVSDEQFFWGSLFPTIWSKIEYFIRNEDIKQDGFKEISKLATDLSKAAQGGDAQRIGSVLMRVLPDIRGQYMAKALIWAVRNGDLELVETLMAHENIAAHYIGEAVIEAARNGDLEVVEKLLAHKDIDAHYIGQALIEAARNGDLEMVEKLLAHKDIDAAIRGNALIAPADRGYLGVVRLLLAPADIAAGVRGRALIAAAGRGYLEVVRLLLDPADIAAETMGLALDAAEGNYAEAVRLLPDPGEDVIITDPSNTALDLAMQDNHQEVIELLRQAIQAAQQNTLHPAAGILHSEEVGTSNVTNDPVPTPMATLNIRCDLHTRRNMLPSIYDSYF